jgi:hypothetical protein
MFVIIGIPTAEKVKAMSPVVESTSTVGRKRSRRGLKLVLMLLLLPVALFAAYTWVTLHFAYSSGERAGYVQKISSKGWICKTWEGELAMTTVPGAVPQIFPFSVRDDAVAHRIEQAAGQRVALSYEQHRGVPGSCFGETEYFITGVRSIGP